jgi:hypothetical protein
MPYSYSDATSMHERLVTGPVVGCVHCEFWHEVAPVDVAHLILQASIAL